MGYSVLKPQIDAIQQLVNDGTDSMELLWLPGVIQVTIWTKQGQYTQYLVDEDGNVQNV